MFLIFTTNIFYGGRSRKTKPRLHFKSFLFDINCLVDFVSTCWQELLVIRRLRELIFSLLISKFLLKISPVNRDRRAKVTKNVCKKMELSRRALFRLLLKRTSYSSTISILPEVSEFGCIHANQDNSRWWLRWSMWMACCELFIIF